MFDLDPGTVKVMSKYEFTEEDWFSRHAPVWQAIIHNFNLRPTKILEIGCFEGRSTVWLIENAFPAEGELYCIDTWEGSREHDGIDMKAVETRFHKNIAVACAERPVNVLRYKERSLTVLASFVGSEAHEGTFDLIYIDGSHETMDVLLDLALCFHLVREGGAIICDDYLFQWGKNVYVPKMAIDAVVNCAHGALQPVINVPLYQMAFIKVPRG